MKEKPQAQALSPFLQESYVSFEFDDVDVDEFDSLLPDDPRMADWRRVAHQTGNMPLFRNRKTMHRIIHEVKNQRLEKRIRKHIMHILESSGGGSVGIVELMRRIEDIDGQAGANASVSLVYVMQAEGLVAIDFQQQLHDFILFDEHHRFYDDNIVVKLLRNH